MKHVVRIAFILLLIAANAAAQAWRGQGRLAGKITGEDKKPIEGVVVQLIMPAEKGAVETKTNA